MSERVRIYQIAKDLGIPSKDLLEFIQVKGYAKVQSVQKSVDAEEAETIAQTWRDAHAPKKAKGKSAKSAAPVVEEAPAVEEAPVEEKAPAKKGGRKGKKTAKAEEAPVIEEVEPAPSSKTSNRKKKEAAPVVEEAPVVEAEAVEEETVEEETVEEVVEAEAVEEETTVEEPKEAETVVFSDEASKEQAMLGFAVDYVTRSFTYAGFPVRVALGERRPNGQEFLLYSNELVNWLGGKDSGLVKEIYRQVSYLLGKSLTYRFRARASMRFLFTALNEIDISPAASELAAVVEETQTAPANADLYEDSADELEQPSGLVEEAEEDEYVVELADGQETSQDGEVTETVAEGDMTEEMRFARVSTLLAERAQALGKSFLVDMLNSHERRQIHTNIANSPKNQVRTFSDGEGIFRRLIISPAGSTPRYRSNQGRR